MTPSGIISTLLALTAALVLLLAALAFGWRLPEWQLPCPRQDAGEEFQ